MSKADGAGISTVEPESGLLDGLDEEAGITDGLGEGGSLVWFFLAEDEAALGLTGPIRAD